MTKGYLLAALGLVGLFATAIPAHAKLDIDYKELARRETQNTQVAQKVAPQQNTVVAQVTPNNR